MRRRVWFDVILPCGIGLHGLLMRSSATECGARWLARLKTRRFPTLKARIQGKRRRIYIEEGAAEGPSWMSVGESKAPRTPKAVFGTAKVKKSLSINAQSSDGKNRAALKGWDIISKDRSYSMTPKPLSILGEIFGQCQSPNLLFLTRLHIMETERQILRPIKHIHCSHTRCLIPTIQYCFGGAMSEPKFGKVESRFYLWCTVRKAPAAFHHPKLWPTSEMSELEASYHSMERDSEGLLASRIS